MAGLIARVFGGRPKPDPDPLPGQGGYDLPPGPYGGTGFPGSTSSTRTLRGASPRAVKIRADTDTGFEQALSATAQVRQASYRGDVPGGSTASPRATPAVATPQPVATELMQGNSAAEFYGGQPLRTRPGYDLAGQNPLSGAARAGGHSQRETTTPWRDAQPVIGAGTPGAANVRNQVAQRYKNPAGQLHGYRAAPRADQPGSTPSTAAAGAEVQVPNRFVFPGGGNQTWSLEREMPYGGRGDGARGADLDGTRYYAAGGYDNFLNAGQGQYGQARLAGPRHRPTMFAEPAPWSTNFYDTTASVGTTDSPGAADQAPDMVYVSPQASRAALNSTGRTG